MANPLKRFRWSWSGFVATILALGLAGGWAVTVSTVAGHAGEYNVPEYVVQAFLGLGQTLAGGLIGYLGARAMHNADQRGGDTDG